MKKKNLSKSHGFYIYIYIYKSTLKWCGLRLKIKVQVANSVECSACTAKQVSFSVFGVILKA